jgi:hypothetical protein
LKHFAKYVDAYHIFNSSHITPDLFEKAERLLNSFEFEFEELYGGKNMVINVHLTKHISKCVSQNGPLCCYTAYNMEDNIGHLISMIQGTTDVLKQCTQKYLLIKNLKSRLDESVKARQFYKKIEDDRFHNKTLNNPNLSRYEIEFIQATIQAAPCKKFASVWLERDFYRIEESACISSNRKSFDSFIATKCGLAGTIKSIFATDCDSTYILFREDYLIQRNDLCDSIKYLEINPTPVYHVAKLEDIMKCVFIKFDHTLAFSTFPNKFERD